MLQYPYPIRLTPIWGKTMRQFSERFSSCRTQQEYTQVGIRIFRFFRTEGSNRFPDRRRIPTCEARHGNLIDFPMLQWEFEETPRPHYNSRNRDVREAFLCIRFVEPGRSIWHLFQTDFTEIMLLFWDVFLLFHTFFRLYNAGQMFFGGASSKKNHSWRLKREFYGTQCQQAMWLSIQTPFALQNTCWGYPNPWTASDGCRISVSKWESIWF